MSQKLPTLMAFFVSFFMHSQNLVWKTNLNDGVTESVEQRKPMLILFTAAGVSENLQNEMFNTRDFASWSRDNIILVKLDLSDLSVSDSDKEQNVKLKQALGVEKLPEICFVSASVRKGKTTFSALGKLPFKSGGVKSWLTDASLLINQ